MKNLRRSVWKGALKAIAIRLWRGRLGVITIAGYGFLALFFGIAYLSEPSGGAATMWTAPDSEHWFGTNALGHDMYRRSLSSGAVVLLSATLASVIGVALATFLAWLVARSATSVGYHWFALISRTSNMVPAIVILLLLSMGTGVGFKSFTAMMALLICITTLSRIGAWFRDQESRGDIIGSTVLGATRGQLVVDCFLPGVLRKSGALICGIVPSVMLGELALNFVGFGVGEKSWGRMIADGTQVIFEAPWLTIYPGIIASLTLITLSVLGWLARRMVDGDLPPRIF